jgi:hypothetical protein
MRGLDAKQRGDQRIYVLARVVKSERRANRAFDTHTSQDRLCAMMAGANRDAFLAQGCAHLFGANIVENERQNSRLLARRTDQAQTRYREKGCGSVIQQLVLVGGNAFNSDLLNIVERGTKSGCVGLTLFTRYVPASTGTQDKNVTNQRGVICSIIGTVLVTFASWRACCSLSV